MKAKIGQNHALKDIVKVSRYLLVSRYFLMFPNDAIYCFRDISRYKTLNPDSDTSQKLFTKNCIFWHCSKVARVLEGVPASSLKNTRNIGTLCVFFIPLYQVVLAAMKKSLHHYSGKGWRKCCKENISHSIFLSILI